MTRAGRVRARQYLESSLCGRWECDVAARGGTTLFETGTGDGIERDNVSLEFTIGPVFFVAVRLSYDDDDDFRRGSTGSEFHPLF